MTRLRHYLRSHRPHLVFVSSWPACIALTLHTTPDSSGLIKVGFGLTFSIACAASLCLFARWTGQKEFTS
ncbi:hypothetical protein E7T09_04255 [Deinococcus sp. KSM4-11]|uniref:hypothetical protein n=1 Tax=Deinococcus sp. KSM4-11 TaxID=2568654 RepID=UPI0010A391B3|nr:hypothetical protein [Deinococcus sp. KSM4-11]THF88426.1 hypothetical protein E7T09_04255 [Deinococcus sp. KSM4-11]